MSSAPRELRLPPPADFLWQYVRSTPLAAAVAEVDEKHRAALERDFTARCRELVENGPPRGLGADDHRFSSATPWRFSFSVGPSSTAPTSSWVPELDLAREWNLLLKETKRDDEA